MSPHINVIMLGHAGDTGDVYFCLCIIMIFYDIHSGNLSRTF